MVEAAPASPWLSDLVGQMGQLKFQMKNLQQLRSPAAPTASPHSLDEDEAEEEDYNSSLSSITTSNTPVHRDRGPIPVPSRQFQRNPNPNPPSQPTKVASQRTSYPLSADSSMKRSKAIEESEGTIVCFDSSINSF